MSKVLFIGDPHLQINRFDLAKQFLEWVNHTVRDIKPDLVVNLGDTFDTHGVLRSEILTEFMYHVQYVYAEGVPYVYLLGNHDQYKPKDAKYHALKHIVPGIRKHFYIVDYTQELFGMTFVPYQIDPTKFPKKTLPICVAHQTFIGADYGSIATKDGVDASTIVGADIIISGHIHTKHSIPPRDGRGATVSYPGSPFSQGVDDIDQVKGLMLFDTETYEQEFIECPLPKWRGLRYEIVQNFSIDDLYNDLAQHLPNSKDHWTVELTGSKAEILAYLDSKRHQELISGVDVKISTKYLDKEKRKLRIEAKSMEQIVSDWVAKVYSGSLDKDLVRMKALEVLTKSHSEQ